MLREYLLEYHKEDLEAILEARDIQKYYSIYINFVSLFEDEAETAQKILQFPRFYLPTCDQAAIEAQQEIAKPEQIVKRKVRIRITAVPVTIDQGRIGELVSTSGIAVRISQPTVLTMVKRILCKKCTHISLLKYQWEIQGFRDVVECDCQEARIKVLPVIEKEDTSDCQEIKLQDKCQAKTIGSYSVGMQVLLLDDLVDKCRPGDYVEICGIVVRQWGPLEVGERLEATTVMIANSVSVRRKIMDGVSSTHEMRDIFKNYWMKYSHNPLLGRDNILASICPQLYGMYTAKLALAIVLAGGVPKCNDGGTRVRGEPHLLLVGDPGTGKSQLLQVASRLAVRSVLTTGIGSTAAGLTATAVKDADGWHLEAGALVLADGGVCCVDEFTTMSSQDRTSVHEAMEQQTISVAKAGLVSTLNSRCTVIAAINPVGGRFKGEDRERREDGDDDHDDDYVDDDCDDDEEKGKAWETKLGDPLLSRFDLILLLKDNRNAEWDDMISDHILRAHCEKSETTGQTDSANSLELLKSEGLWKEDTLKEYLAYIHCLQPEMTKEAEMVLRATYLYHRSLPDRREERTTVRLLDSLIRLSEGHARLMYKTKVEIMDAIFVAKLIGTETTFEVDVGCSFPVDPLATYRSEGEVLLKTIGLQRLEHLL